jgi:hypothetical protein
MQNLSISNIKALEANEDWFVAPVFHGEDTTLVVQDGCVIVDGTKCYVSSFIKNGTQLLATVVRSRAPGYPSTVVINDIYSYGTQVLDVVVMQERLKLIASLTTSFNSEFGFEMFGTQCISPYVFVVKRVNIDDVIHCQDQRLRGVKYVNAVSFDEPIYLSVDEAIKLIASSKTRVKLTSAEAYSANRFPPVNNEAQRVLSYKRMIYAAIKKMSGAWNDVNRSSHLAGLLPFDRDDLLQQGFLEVTIALRRYDATHNSNAKESTFVYKHLWNRFGQIAHKHKKKSKGYGVTHVRDVIEDGNLTSSYEACGV